MTTYTAPLQFGSNYFVYISDPGISWAPAEAAAESMSYLGATGYLATPTSAAENDFLLSLVTTTYSDFSGAWLGGELFGGVGPGGSQSGTDGGSAGKSGLLLDNCFQWVKTRLPVPMRIGVVGNLTIRTRAAPST
jgi:hypothetical protein